MSDLPELPPSRLRGPLWVLGAACLAFGLWGSAYGVDTDWRRVGVLVVGSALAHDLLLAPVVVAVMWWGRHLLPRGAGRWLGGGLLVTGSLLAVAVPVVGRFGERADDASLLPKDYTTGLLVALAVVWAVVAVGVAVDARRDRAAAVRGWREDGGAGDGNRTRVVSLED